MKASRELLDELQDISKQLTDLAETPEEHELDADAIVDLSLARQSVDKLIQRVHRLVE